MTEYFEIMSETGTYNNNAWQFIMSDIIDKLWKISVKTGSLNSARLHAIVSV